MVYYLGVDVGTTSAKAVAFSPAGDVLASASKGYVLHHPAPGWSEQNPDEILEATVSTISQVLSTFNHPPVFVSFSAAMHSLLLVDENGRPLTPCIVWADNRAAAVAERLRRREERRQFYQTTGVPLHPMSPLCKLVWLRENEPQLFGSAHKFIGIKDYLFFRLFGEFVTDTGLASATGLMNLATLQWDVQALQIAGITEEKLPAIKNGKTVFWLAESGKRLLPQLAATPFVLGGSDGALANLGSGATTPNTVAVSIGTSSAVRTVVNRPFADAQMRTFCYHLKDRDYIVGGAGNNGAVVLKWLRKKILESAKPLTALLQKAESVSPGSDGLLFVPYILGERAPVWNAKARGVFSGFGIQHTQAHLVRACMEGVIFCVYSIAKQIFEKNPVTVIQAAGGFAKSGLWVQMLADVCNKPVHLSATVESSALGAVMLGLEAMNLPPIPSTSPVKIFSPNQANHAVYQQRFQVFEKTIAAMNAATKDSSASENISLPKAD